MKTRHLIPTLLVLGAALMAATMASATVFVDPTAPGSQDGSSWVNAFHALQPAIDASAAGGGDVWVAGGPAGIPIVYGENRAESWGSPASVTGSLVMKDNVAMYGGFEGYRGGSGKQETALNQRATALNVAVIDGSTSRAGSAAYHVVVFGRNGMPTFGATLDGFIITGGNAAGISGDYHTWRGGGIYNWGSQPNIQNCVIIGNTAAVSGGGIANETGAGQEANANIANCVVVNNTAVRAADDYLAGNPVPVRGGGGIFNDMATPNLWHVTVLSNAIGNPAYTTFGAASGGVYTWDHNLALTSSIVWSNGTSGQLDQPAGGTAVYNITYSDVEGGAPGTGNIDANPNLAGNYAPNAGSVVINAAQPGLNPPVDYRLVTRPVGVVADMGAAEYSPNGPNAVCAAHTVVLDGAGAGSLTAANIDGGSTAEAGILSVVAGQTAFDCGDLGANTVSLTVTDMLGRTASCDATVTVEDNEDPVITVCATDQAISDPGDCSATVPDFTAGVTATDNCGATISQSPLAGSAAAIGDTTVTITATDAAGNTDTCTATLTVNDVTDPAITNCAGNQTIGSDVNCQALVPDFTAGVTATDCDGTLMMSQSPLSGTTVGLGDTTVTITVTDTSGNSATCDATLTVTATPPAAPALAAISPDTGASATDFITSGTNFQLLGTCPVGVVLNVRLGLAPGVYIQNYSDIPTAGGNFLIPLNGVAPFTYYMQFQSENACGTQGAWSAEYSVTIDTAVPTITECAPAQTVEADDATCLGTIPDLTGGVVATDNVPGTLTVTQSPLAGTTAAIGDTTVTLTVTDVAGNTATCDTIVTVADTPPAAPALVAMNPDTGASPTDFITNATTFQLLGSCPVGVTLNAQIGLAPGVYIQNYNDLPTAGGQFLIPLNGVAPFTYYMHFQVKKSCGTLSAWSEEYVVTVDTMLPTITTCAADQTVAADAGCTEGIVPDFTAGVVATDNVPGTLTVAQSPLAGTTAPLGDTTVTLTVTDVAGNEATCTATLTVADQTGPVFSVCATDQQLVPGPGCTGIVPDMQAEPVAADACGGNVVITQSPAPGTSFTGAVTVTFTAEDERGNTSTCEATVSLVDTEDPVAACQNATVGLSNGGVLEGSDIDGGSTDNCIVDELLVDGAESITYTCADLGDHTVTLTVLDANGNSDTCTATVTVVDDADPVVTLVGDAAVVLDNGDTYTELGATAEDNCDGTLAVTIGGNPVNDRILGTYTVLYTATDAAGNVGTASREVTVQRVACALVVEAVASDVAALPGETVTLEVALGAANCAVGDVHYAWKKDDGSKALVDVPGSADAPTLVFPAVTPADSGVYQCEVSDDMYAVLSPQITLTVDPGVPAAGIAGLGLAALAAALTGARALRRRK